MLSDWGYIYIIFGIILTILGLVILPITGIGDLRAIASLISPSGGVIVLIGISIRVDQRRNKHK